MTYKYCVAKPKFSGNEAKYVAEAVETGMVSSRSPFVERFEGAMASFTGTKYAVACNSGTSALHLAIKALGIGEGDEVIVTEFTMIASAWAVTYSGAKPVFVDCGDDLNIDPLLIEEKITEKTKAIMVVHVYGRACDMDAIMAIAKKHDLKVIEDACEAHGAMYKGKRVGSIGDIGCFSLFGNKIITAGEGGVLTTDNEEVAKRAQYLRTMSFEEHHTFLHKEVGFNYRMTGLQAAVALGQLERIEKFLWQRNEICRWYDEELENLSLIRPEGSVLWMYDIIVGDRRDALMAYLEEEGIETRLFFKPMSSQPMYEDAFCPKAFHFSISGCYLPVYTDLTHEDVKFICQKVQHFLQKTRQSQT